MFGFKNVCTKFGTFVCDGCKSAHQGISHRCKTIGQATFTAEGRFEAVVPERLSTN